MFLTLFYPFIKFVLGTLYPAYKTWKSLKRKDETIRRRWMKYWVSFAVFQTVEYFADFTIAFVMPFYIELKLSALMWLVNMRASSLIDSAIDKELKKREKMIDGWLKRCHNEFIGVAWFEFSRCAIAILATILKSMAASHNVGISDNRPMEIDEECDRSNNNDNNNEIDYNISEFSDTALVPGRASARGIRYKRERGSTMQIDCID